VAPERFDPKNPFVNNDFNYVRAGALLGLDWDLNFLHHRDQARVQRLEANQLQAQLQPLTMLVEQEVREAYLKAVQARADLEEGRDALQASENWFRAEMQTFDIGIGRINDVIDAFEANVELRTLQLQNIANFNVAVSELSQKVGVDLAGG
jgi:outer membrane protein TolC